MRRRVVVGSFLFWLVAVPALSGCLGGDEVDDGGGPGFTEDSGSLVGLVMDVNLNPLVEATVTLLDDMDETVASAATGPDGRYAVELVPPGRYRAVAAETMCCYEDVKSVEILAGQAVSQDFRLEFIDPDDIRTPRVDGPYDWNGVYECTIGPYRVCQSNQWRNAVVIEPGAKTIHVGLEWGPNPVLGADDLNLRLVNRPARDVVITEQSGTPGFEIVLDDSVIDDEDLKLENYEKSSWALMFEVEPVEMDALYGQRFTVWWAVHYWDPAPDSYSALPDR